MYYIQHKFYKTRATIWIDRFPKSRLGSSIDPLIIVMASTAEESILIKAYCATLHLGTKQIHHLESHNFKPDKIITTLLYWIELDIEAFEKGLNNSGIKNLGRKLKRKVKNAVSIWKDNTKQANNMEVSVHSFFRSFVISFCRSSKRCKDFSLSSLKRCNNL